MEQNKSNNACMKTILLVEDEFAIQEMLTAFLEGQGYKVISVYDGVEAREWIDSGTLIHLILLDWMLPKKSGIQLLAELKNTQKHKHIPVIMLSARAELEDRIEGLDVGADDYIAKPFVLKELLSRIKALIRRVDEYKVIDGEFVELDGLMVDLTRHLLTIHNETVTIGRLEFNLLAFFMTHIDWVYSRVQLLDHVWGIDSDVDERTVDVSIGRLRKILEPSGHDKYLQTVRGEGYRFSAKV